MSELFMDDPMSNRTQGARPAPSDPNAQSRIQTPQQVMAARRQREARRAEQEARQRQPQEVNPTRRRQQDDVVGVGAIPTSQQTRPAYNEADNPSRLQAGQSVTIGGRSDNIIPTSNGLPARPTNAAVNQGQPRPVQGGQQAPFATAASGQAGNPAYGSQVQRDRTEAFEKLSMPAVAGTKAPQQQDTNYPQQTTSSQPSRSGFPHAFERWETLSSHWEGLTSYWIRKLQENTNELDGKPIDKQMARQITDLSAAGANLFHAVVELQRLRASSERKFQRWFFETRNEQEQTQEKIADLQAQLQAERQNRPQMIQSSAPDETLRSEKAKAEELVREMRRELQISKEEARRAWEELGRREQEERERTIALRSGEPTLIGGVQVLPMQGLSSRHNTTSSNRPVTRDGPYPGGPGATMMGGQVPDSRTQTPLESPGQEEHQFHYRPGTTSPTDTDPFTETTRPSEPPLRHEPDMRFLSTGSPRPHQSQTSQQSLSAARGVASASPSQSQRSAPNRTNPSDQRSYVPSTLSGAASVQSEEEYHTGPDGQYIRDAQGRPIPYREPIGGYEDVASDDEDHTADIAREQMLAQQYAQRQQSSRHASPGQANLPVASRSPQQLPSSAYATTTPQSQHATFYEDSPADTQRTTSSTISPVTPQQPLTGRLTSPLRDPVDYEGAGYGDDDQSYHQSQPASSTPGGAPRHHVPTRLSDILEERTSSVISSGSNPNQTQQHYPYPPPFTSADPNIGTRR